MNETPIFTSLPEAGYVGASFLLHPGPNSYLQDESDNGYFFETYLRFPTGSLVLYGPNGVGKSRVLRAVRESLGATEDRQHETLLFRKDILGKFSAERTVDVLLNRQLNVHGAPPPRLSKALAEAIAEDGQLCLRRFPTGARGSEQVAVGLAQDSDQPLVREAVRVLLEQLHRPYEDPRAFVDLVEANRTRLKPFRLIRLVMHLVVNEDDYGLDILDPLGEQISDATLRFLKSPKGQELLESMDWAAYCFFLEGLEPNLLFDGDEQLLENWLSFGRFTERDRPAWAPWPLEWMGSQTPRAPELPNFGRDTIADVDELTSTPSILFKKWVFGDLEHRAPQISELATTLAKKLLLNAPTVRLNFGRDAYVDLGDYDEEGEEDEEDWHLLVGAVPTWEIGDPYSGAELGLETFSPTQQRWLTLAINLAVWIEKRRNQLELQGKPLPKVAVLFCDEPETGLPLEAQRHLSYGLSSISSTFGVTFILASHSPAILSDSGFGLAQVYRRPKPSRRRPTLPEIRTLEEGERSRLAQAGVPPSEMLYLYRTILLVEGLHDQWFLDELVGPELEQLRVKLLPVHGAKQAAALFASEAGLLFEHAPQARFVVAVDGTKQELLEAMLAEAQGEASEAERLAALGEIVSNGEPSDEAKVMHALLRKAIETDRVGDVGGLFGFRERDIIEYLDPAAFGLDLTWPELRVKHQERIENKKGTPRDFKKWLGLSFNASFDESAIRSAVPQDSIPEEVLTLLDLCRAVDEPIEMEDES